MAGPSSRRRNQLERYAGGEHFLVEGWLQQVSAEMICRLAEYQVDSDLPGAVGEIGIHHGRLFILLKLSSSERERAFAVDVFDSQDLNLDSSGLGDRAIFERHLRRYSIDLEEVAVFEQSSLELSGDEIEAAVGPVRIMSVDGGHTVECVLNDLAIADRVLAPHGVVVLDDVFNGTWPSVVSGYAEYLTGAPQLIPFAVSPNKVYSAAADHVERYQHLLRNSFEQDFDRSDSLFGFPVDTYGEWRPRSARPPRLKRFSQTISKRLSAAGARLRS